MNAAADELLVGEEIGDLEDVGEQAQELGGGEGAVEFRDRPRKLARIGDLDLPLLVDRREHTADLHGVFEGREGLGHLLGEVLIEEVIDAAVGERLGPSDAFPEIISIDRIDSHFNFDRNPPLWLNAQVTQGHPRGAHPRDLVP